MSWCAFGAPKERLRPVAPGLKPRNDEDEKENEEAENGEPVANEHDDDDEKEIDEAIMTAHPA